MSQNDPRGNLSTFGDFGLYCNSSASGQNIWSAYFSHTYTSEGEIGDVNVELEDKSFTPGWGSVIGTAMGETEYGKGSAFFNAALAPEGYLFDNKIQGWLRTGSLARTYDGYQAIPTAFNALHSFVGPMAKLFFGPQWGEYVTRANVPYQNLRGTQRLPVDYVWACPPSGGLSARLLPYYYTDTSSVPFESVYDGTSLTSSVETLLGRLYQSSGACLAILSGGTLANYGGESTSERVYSAVTESTFLTEDGEGVSVSERLARIESAVSQLIALTTYSYYISGASVDSAPASGQSVAEGVLNYLKQFLGSGAPDPVPPLEEEGEERTEEEENNGNAGS